MQKLYWNQIIHNDRHERDESGRIVIDLLNQLEAHRGEVCDYKSKVTPEQNVPDSQFSKLLSDREPNLPSFSGRCAGEMELTLDF